ncbi:hypothetical protein LTR37_004177 [Vermiconidia calcicola]|uniref:Uncharacterized protein n=1 Tax=Vermiconidia calcicola TaxID=1690605 RepID=A0ACC3NNA0_9PEZI|nr:hypothetical protein LTR37_004177 [Vermiconidia calcicola]
MAGNVSTGWVPEEKHQKLVIKYNQLCQRYRDLHHKHNGCRERINKANEYMRQADERCAATKVTVQQWRAWIDKNGVPTQERSNRDSTVPERASSKDTTTPIQRHSSQRVASSQTTETDQTSSSPKKPDNPSDDEPEVVSTRSIRRKRSDLTRAMPPPVRVKQEPNSPENPIELASENYSSPHATRKRAFRTETSDLDALVVHHNTPRKRKRRRAASEEASRPRTILRTTSSLSESGLPDNVPEMPAKVEAHTEIPPLYPDVTFRDFALLPAEQLDERKALRQRSPNIPSTSPQGNTVRTTVKRKRGNEDARKKIAFLSEDGDDSTSQVVTRQAKSTPPTSVSRRLGALLEEKPSPPPGLLPQRRTPETVIRRRERFTPPIKQERKAAQKPIQEPRSAPKATERSAVPFKRPRGFEKSPTPALPDDEPLRSRPVGSLRLEDFKINPKYLGAEFAFADTFRGREQRRCLPGCTKPDCCGNAFRKAIEVGAVKSTKTDQQMLEEYLGPEWDLIMGAYAPEKGRDLIMQARAHAFAGQFGKHRQAFERRSTPPGFWRTDMPTTQEENEDRSRAQEMERQKIEERWREAMRPGGRWMFRDDSGE